MTMTKLSRKCLFLLYLLGPCFGALTDPISIAELLGIQITDSPTAMASDSPTDSPAPSPSPSATPTESPTESPAPSPSPSAAPTEAPSGTNGPTPAPTEAPTDSPAPSPAPTVTPTDKPSFAPSHPPTNVPTATPEPTDQPSAIPSDSPSEIPTDKPSDTPTVSSAPSRQPSAAPTATPSATPSSAPTSSPTMSPKPSTIPSDAPSQFPSLKPSSSPTKTPTTSPTRAPTDRPSSAPTGAPSTPSSSPSAEHSAKPSAAPSAAPTESGFKTKTGITNVLLIDIEREMGDEPLARFEIETLDFIRDTQPPTEGFEVKILAATVLTQQIVYPEREEADDEDGGRRHALSEVALQVSFRTVGVITQGQAPSNFNLTDITDAGFKMYFDEYLFRLANSDPFFAPLLKVSSFNAINSSDEEIKKGSKGQFITAILFSTVAFIVAIFASYYAINKHLKAQKRRITDKSRMLEYPGHIEGKEGTHSFSDSEDSEKQDVTNKPMPLDIEQCMDGLEDVGLSPPVVASPFNGCKPIPEECHPLSPSTLGAESRRSSFGRFSETSANIKKWLTPRRSVFQNVPDSMDTPARSDPPDSEISFNVRPNAQSVDPDALKASTANKKGVLSDERETIGGNAKEMKQTISGQTPLSIPMSFFSRGGGATSEASSGTPMGSLADSTVSSFFMKMGKSVFTGRKSMQSEAGRSAAAEQLNYAWGSDAGTSEVNGKGGQKYTFGSTSGGSEAYSKASEMKMPELNEANLAKMLNPEPSKEKANRPETSRSYQEKKSERTQGAPPLAKMLNTEPSNKKENRPETSRSYYKEEKPERTQGATPDSSTNDEPGYSARKGKSSKNQYRTYDYDEQESPMEHRSKRSRTFDEETAYSEQSELHLNENVISKTLGARPVGPVEPGKFEQGSYVGHDYGQRLGVRAPSTVGARSQVSDDPAPNSKSQRKNNYMLGAKPLGATEKDQLKEKSSLGSIMKREGTYDVFAPSGPIGIVVDTSKEGPAVHSLKSTSPLLGLINPGDLIIALDDEDTRDMTAASLTRLMAKKSRQKERKITLLAPNGF